MIVNTLVAGLKPETAVLRCVYSGAEHEIAAACFVPVTSREGEDALYHALKVEQRLDPLCHDVLGRKSNVTSFHRQVREARQGPQPLRHLLQRVEGQVKCL